MDSATPPRNAAIKTTQLTKHYRGVEALTDLSITVPTGSIYGFLGPNGSGKTTTIRLLLAFIRATSGSAAILGHDCWQDCVNARRQIGYLVPANAFYPEMKGQDQLDYAAKLSGRAPVLRDRVLEALALDQQALERKVHEYSRGMRQKLSITAAMQHDPDLLILDEPTEGLDPLVRRNLEELLRERHRAGRTIFMSSHDLPEVERLCDMVAIVRRGRLVAEEEVATLKERQLRRVAVTFRGETPAALQQLPVVRSLIHQNGRLEMLVERDLNPVLALLGQYPVEDLLISEPGLDEIFAEFYQDEEPASPAPAQVVGQE